MDCATGGTAGLGLLTASYMLSCGAASLILLGRTGRCANADDMRLLTDDRCDACVTLLRADVSGRSEAGHAVAAAHENPVRLGGLVHAAGLQARHFLHLCSWHLSQGIHKLLFLSEQLSSFPCPFCKGLSARKLHNRQLEVLLYVSVRWRRGC